MPEVLRIAIPGGEVVERRLPQREVTLGRDRANAIVVEHPSVGRWHARLVPEFSGWAVVDLESATGTFVNGQRIDPGVMTPLDLGATIRIGEVQGVIVESFTAEAPTEEPESTREAFALKLQPPTEPIEPGKHGSLTLEVRNIGTQSEDVVISVPSLPPEWVEIRPPSLALAPGGHDEATIVIHPPRQPGARHGHHDVTIAVTSRLRPNEERELTSVVILPYYDTEAILDPPESTGEYRLTLRNNGNTTMEFDVAASTELVGATVEVAEPLVSLAPGASREVAVRVGGFERPLWRKPPAAPLGVEVQTRSGGHRHELSALLHRHPRYPWLPYAVLTAIAAGVVLAAWALDWWWFG